MSGQKISGYTLIELMVTIAIVGIVVAIAVPSFQNVMAGGRITSAANDVVSAVAIARSEAMKLHRSISIDENLSLNNGVGGFEVKDGGTLIKEYLYNDNVTTAFQSISFRSNGLRSGAGDLVILVCDKSVEGKGRQISISISGSTSVSEYTGYCS